MILLIMLMRHSKSMWASLLVGSLILLCPSSAGAFIAPIFFFFLPFRVFFFAVTFVPIFLVLGERHVP